MDIREAYEQVLRNQQLKEAPGVGAVLQGAGRVVTNPQVIKQGGKVGGSLALQKLQDWPEYRQYRDEGYTQQEAAEKVATRLGLNVGGSIVGGLAGGVGGPWGSAAGGVLGGPGLVALVDALENEKTQKQNQYEAGVVWDDKSGKYVHKPEALTQNRRESDEEYAARVKAGEDMAKKLNSAEGGPKAPTWLEYERRREKERAKEAADEQRRKDRGETALPLGKSRTGGDVTKQFGIPNYTVSGITYDGRTGRPLEDQPKPEEKPETNSELDDIINEPYTADQNIPDDKPDDVTKPEDAKPGTDNEGKPEQKPEQKPGTDKEGDKNLTPMQQWAKNFPKLAAKVKAGQVGYDEIQAMNKPQATGSVSGTSASGQPIMTADVERRNQERSNQQRPTTPNKPGGLMDRLADYQREKGYGDDAPSPQRTPSAGSQTQRTSANNSSDTGMIGTGNRGVTARTAPGRAVERAWDATADAVQGTRNAATRAWRSNPAEKVKDAVQDTVRSQAVQTVKNQGQKALGALNNKRKQWTAPLGSNE